MLIAYGSYSHPENETELVSIVKDVLRGTFGQRTGTREQWTLRGRLAAASVSELSTAIAALEAAHASDGLNLTLYTDSGSTSSAHAIQSGRTLGGVKVTGLRYPDGKGAEYSTWRTYEVTYEAEYLSQTGGLDTYAESIEQIGGGPRDEYVTVLQGPPVKVRVAQQTTFKGRQTGRAVGIGAYPTFPPPVWPQHEHVDRRQLMRDAPQYDNGGQHKFGISWSYEFEAVGPLGTPSSAPPL